jgi:uncharacterized protein (TIGR03435 family)
MDRRRPCKSHQVHWIADGQGRSQGCSRADVRQHNFDVAYLPELSPGAQASGRSPDALGPTFTEELHKQLGIKLVQQKGLYDYLIVDHAERPTEN